jgi:hypothetical protein
MEFTTLNNNTYIFEKEELCNSTQFLLDKPNDDGIIYIFMSGGAPYNIYAHYEYSICNYPYEESRKMSGLMQTGITHENIKIRVRVEDLIEENLIVI